MSPLYYPYNQVVFQGRISGDIIMQQAKFSLTPPLVEFLNSYQRFGFKDKSSMVQVALQRLKEEFDLQQLKQSAEWYAEVYEQDTELHELAEIAIVGWPE